MIYKLEKTATGKTIKMLNVLALVLVTLFVMSVVITNSAEAFSLTGKVVAIDRDAGTLTLDPRYCYGPNFGGRMSLRTFAVERATSIKMGNENKDFRSIRVGDWVVLNYHQANNGLVVTDDIAISSQPAIGCMEERG